MKRTYVIVPRTISSKPPLTLSCGFAMAQIHHATAKACMWFDVNPGDIGIVLEVPNSRYLSRLSDDLYYTGIRFIEYWEESHLFEGKELTVLVTEPSDKLDVLEAIQLWDCGCIEQLSSTSSIG